MYLPDPSVAYVWIVVVLLITLLLGVLAGLEVGKRIARREAAEARAGITVRGKEKAPASPVAPEPAQGIPEGMPLTPLVGVVPPSGATRFESGPNPYTRLQASTEQREAAQSEVAQPARKPATHPIPVTREPISHNGLLSMTVPELMKIVEANARASLSPRTDTATIPAVTSDGMVVGSIEVEQPVSTGEVVVVDRRVHAELPDGSEVVRYEKAGKWFHEGPGLRRRVTLAQAADLAVQAPGARVYYGLPGGGIFDLRVRQGGETGVRA